MLKKNLPRHFFKFFFILPLFKKKNILTICLLNALKTIYNVPQARPVVIEQGNQLYITAADGRFTR
jgi:hypothetical protein